MADVAARARLELLVVRSAQLATLLIAAFVGYRRADDPTALVGAAFLGTIGVFSVTLPDRLAFAWRSLPRAASVPLWLPFLSSVAVAAWGYSFFAMFPRRRFRSRLAWIGVWLPMVPGIAGQAWLGLHIIGRSEPAPPIAWWPQMLLVLGVGYLVAALVRLFMTYRHLTDLNERRRVRVVMIGALVGGLSGMPVVLSYWRASSNSFSQPLLGSPLVTLGTFLFLVLPLSFAYTILRHRLFDISMIVRQGLRYMLARRVLVTLVPMVFAALGVDLLLHGDEPLSRTVERRLWIYGSVIGLVLVARSQQHKWLNLLDQRFFRERYNAQRLLRQIAEDLRLSPTLGPVAASVSARIELALHPSFVAILIRHPHETGYQTLASAPEGVLLPLADTGGPRPHETDMVAPIAGVTGANASGLLVLGPKRSEEPYTADDRELLLAIAESIALRLSGAEPERDAVGRFAECPACGAAMWTASNSARWTDARSLQSPRRAHFSSATRSNTVSAVAAWALSTSRLTRGSIAASPRS